MRVEHIVENKYRVELSDNEQRAVEIQAENCNISNVAALDCIITDGFDCYDVSVD